MKKINGDGEIPGMGGMMFPFGGMDNDYFLQPVCFKDCDDHYELIYTGEFESVGRESVEITKLMQDLKDGDKTKEIHILINSVGGDCENLSMVLQQVLQYQYRVTVCCGAAMSAGFILWACGHERYVSPYSELMYHTIFSGYEGKGIELSSYGNHVERLTEELMGAVNMDDLISKEDFQKGKSTEVWYLGKDFIASGKARDYSEYCNRMIPQSICTIVAGNNFFVKTNQGYAMLDINTDRFYTYGELVALNAATDELSEETEDVIENCGSSSSSSAEKEKKKLKRGSDKKKSKKTRKSN